MHKSMEILETIESLRVQKEFKFSQSELLDQLWAKKPFQKLAVNPQSKDSNILEVDHLSYLFADESAVNISDFENVSCDKDLFLSLKNLFCDKCKKKAPCKKELIKFTSALIFAVNSKVPVITRRGSKKGPYIEIIEALASHNLIIHVKTQPDKFSTNASWIQPSKVLIKIVKDFKIEQPDVDEIYIRLRKKNRLCSINRMRNRNITKFKKAIEQLKEFNKLLFDSSITVSDKTLRPIVYRVFNKNDNMDMGGRYYANYQKLPSGKRKKHKDEPYNRQNIKIDGEDTVEPDFNSIHLNIMYALSNKVLDKDPYSIPGFDRTLIKKTSLILLNCNKLSVFKSNITKSANPEIKSYNLDYQNSLKKFEDGISFSKPEKYKVLQGFIDDVPNFLDAKKFLNVLFTFHEPIKEFFNEEDLGLRLQNYDSQIMSKVIDKLIEAKIPALPIHDSLRCKKSDFEAVKKFMIKAFKEVFGEKFNIIVNCDEIDKKETLPSAVKLNDVEFYSLWDLSNDGVLNNDFYNYIVDLEDTYEFSDIGELGFRT